MRVLPSLLSLPQHSLLSSPPQLLYLSLPLRLLLASFFFLLQHLHLTAASSSLCPCLYSPLENHFPIAILSLFFFFLSLSTHASFLSYACFPLFSPSHDSLCRHLPLSPLSSSIFSFLLSLVHAEENYSHVRKKIFSTLRKLSIVAPLLISLSPCFSQSLSLALPLSPPFSLSLSFLLHMWNKIIRVRMRKFSPPQENSLP